MAATGPDSENLGEITEINITPFVDVVLVLLVIFMVAAPTLMKDVIGIQLPKSGSSDTKAPVSVSVAVNKAGQILFNGEVSAPEAIVDQVKEALKTNTELQVIIAADKMSYHGDVVKAVDLVRSAGATRFAFQIEKP